MSPLSSTGARLEISAPKVFTVGRVFAITLGGVVLALPVILLALVIASTLSFSLWTFLLPVLAVAVATLLLPVHGNPYVARLVRSMCPAARTGQPGFIVQLTLVPRLRSGLRALLDDADDIGWLTWDDSALVFAGDSIQLSVPFDHLSRVRPRNIGWHGLFLYGPRITLEVSGLPQASSLEFAERSSWLFPASRKTAKALGARLAERVHRASA